MKTPPPPLTPASIRSMTGYALVRRQTNAGELTCSLRSVNGRGLDLHFYLPGEFAVFENSLRSLLKEKIGRGHVEVRLSLSAQQREERSFYNRALLEKHLTAFRQASEEFGLNAEPDLNRLLGLPGVLDLGRDSVTLDDAFGTDVLAVSALCADELNVYRQREGFALVEAISAELRALEESLAALIEIRGKIVPYLTNRLQERLKALLNESHLAENRFLEEATLLADKSDIQEELTRLGIHAKELLRILETGGDAGKRLDFLLQELNRETNTILSKSATVGDLGIQITGIGLGVKANIERMREQSLNLE